MGEIGSVTSVGVLRVRSGERFREEDALATEEPLEIRVGYLENGVALRRSVSITMRTPGNDTELAVGFLFTEGILTRREQVADVVKCQQPNTVRVEIRQGAEIALERLTRHFYATSSCGVCGKSSLDALSVAGLAPLPEQSLRIRETSLLQLPHRLRAAQSVFDRTGGLHAAALFDGEGNLLSSREDVGRHNAVDKLVGAEFLAGRTPRSGALLLVSGRASFELVQKTIVAGIPLLAAVGAPSSLAVSLARKFNLTLVGFLRDERFNVYTGEGRILS